MAKWQDTLLKMWKETLGGKYIRLHEANVI